MSEFKFRRVVSYDRSNPVPSGLVNVYERDADQHIGQLLPADGGGYILRNREGVRLSDFDSGRTPAWVGVNREAAARMLRLYVAQQEKRMAARTGSVSEGCPNTWHNTSDYRVHTACPECPSAIGLRIAIRILANAANVRDSGGDDSTELRSRVEDLEDLLYAEDRVVGRPQVDR